MERKFAEQIVSEIWSREDEMYPDIPFPETPEIAKYKQGDFVELDDHRGLAVVLAIVQDDYGIDQLQVEFSDGEIGIIDPFEIKRKVGRK